MKKKLTIILLLSALCLTISACNMNTLNKVDGSDSTEMHTDGSLDDPVVLPEKGESPLLTLESINEYTKYLTLSKMPIDFVTYDQIELIGDFKSLVFLSDAYSNDYSSYMYTLIDSEGFEITLYVNNSAEILSTVTTVTEVDTKNMRSLSNTHSGTYVSGNINYQYVSGKLISISWVNQNINYTLCGTSMLYEYPPAASTFVGKMLNTDTAKNIYDTIFDDASK